MARHRKGWKSEDRTKHGEPLPDAERAIRVQKLHDADRAFHEAMAQSEAAAELRHRLTPED